MENSEPTDAELIAQLEQRQREAATEGAELISSLSHSRTMGILSRSMDPLTAEQIARRDAENIERERSREMRARAELWLSFANGRGSRYADCRLETFDTSSPKQAAAVNALKEYRDTMADRLADGEGIVLFGPKGTGKDHLLVSLCPVAFAMGKRVVWQNGMDLFGEMRDRMDSGESERALVSRLVYPDVLYLSDPVPPIGSLTEFQASMMFRILDGRYSRRKATWCSVNVSKGSELEERMGPQNVDRLRDGALSIHCDWPSYRAVSKHITGRG